MQALLPLLPKRPHSACSCPGHPDAPHPVRPHSQPSDTPSRALGHTTAQLHFSDDYNPFLPHTVARSAPHKPQEYQHTPTTEVKRCKTEAQLQAQAWAHSEPNHGQTRPSNSHTFERPVPPAHAHARSLSLPETSEQQWSRLNRDCAASAPPPAAAVALDHQSHTPPRPSSAPPTQAAPPLAAAPPGILPPPPHPGSREPQALPTPPPPHNPHNPPSEPPPSFRMNQQPGSPHEHTGSAGSGSILAVKRPLSPSPACPLQPPPGASSAIHRHPPAPPTAAPGWPMAPAPQAAAPRFGMHADASLEASRRLPDAALPPQAAPLHELLRCQQRVRALCAWSALCCRTRPRHLQPLQPAAGIAIGRPGPPMHSSIDQGAQNVLQRSACMHASSNLAMLDRV